VRNASLYALKPADHGGVNLIYSTDLLGQMHYHQCTILALRSEVQLPIE
jgi:hypothetical protein